MKVPHTRLSTHMSGSAKEIERRLRHLFAKHKRPALALVAVVALAIALCGGLVACRQNVADGTGTSFAFRVNGQFYQLGTTATGFLGEPLSVREEVEITPLVAQRLGRILRTEDYGTTQLVYAYAPANGQWRLEELATEDPDIRITGGIGVGSTLEQVQTARPDLEKQEGSRTFCVGNGMTGRNEGWCSVTMDEGQVTSILLYDPAVQPEYQIVEPIGIAAFPLNPIPGSEDKTPPERATGDSFTIPMSVSAGEPLPLTWRDAQDCRVLLYSAENDYRLDRILDIPSEIPGLEPGTYVAVLEFDLMGEDGAAYPFNNSYILHVR